VLDVNVADRNPNNDGNPVQSIERSVIK
jgi:hypothetical protein